MGGCFHPEDHIPGPGNVNPLPCDVADDEGATSVVVSATLLGSNDPIGVAQID